MSMWLVDHDSGVRQAVAVVLGASSQQEGSHAAGLPHTPGGHWRVDVLHGVVDTKTCRDRATWRGGGEEGGKKKVERE